MSAQTPKKVGGPGRGDSLDSNDSLNWSQRAPEGLPLKDLVIVVDPGHGGKDPGAISNGVCEKDLTLTISQALAQSIEKLGGKAILTRSDDSFVDLNERVAIAKRAKAHLFVSVHINAAGNNTATGVETCYSNPDSKQLAELIAGELSECLCEKNRGAHKRSLRVTKNSIPSVLAEVGFISTACVRLKLVERDYQMRIAQAISKGIVAFTKEHKF